MCQLILGLRLVSFFKFALCRLGYNYFDCLHNPHGGVESIKKPILALTIDVLRWRFILITNDRLQHWQSTLLRWLYFKNNTSDEGQTLSIDTENYD